MEYLREENRAKTLIVKQLKTKVTTLNQNSLAGNCCCHVVNTPS